MPSKFLDQIEEIIVAPFAELADVDACDHDFLAAFGRHLVSLIDNLTDGS